MSMGNVSAVGAGQTQPGPGEAGSERIIPDFVSKSWALCPAADVISLHTFRIAWILILSTQTFGYGNFEWGRLASKCRF